MSKRYDHLATLSYRAALLSGIGMLLEWDQETLMPKGGIELRSKQSELIAGLLHKEKTGKEFEQALQSLIDLETGTILDHSLTARQKASVRELRRDYLKEAKLPIEFIEKWTMTTSAATHAWSEAKNNDDFKAFQPHLEKIVELSKQKAELLGYTEHPYDPLIDYFEPTMTTAEVVILLKRLKIPLLDLLKKIQTKHIPDSSFLKKVYPLDKQLEFGKTLLGAMGLDPKYSRLDESAHPMCVPIHPHDMRMTTRIYPTDVTCNILSCVHEGGHGLYHSNLPIADLGTPLANAASYAIDESQSRTWETIIARSYPFWEHWFPLLQNTFPTQLSKVTLEEFYQGLNTVKSSFIRTDSDEVSYNLHILLRFELELDLIEGSLKVQDLPEAWNEKMLSYFGIIPPSHSLGCLQDIHWALGAIGYFPTYTLGNLYAAQFFETFASKHPNWKKRVASGELAFIAYWQKEEIHRFGREYLPEDLVEKVTGKPLSEKPFIDYLKAKYTPLYHLS